VTFPGKRGCIDVVTGLEMGECPGLSGGLKIRTGGKWEVEGRETGRLCGVMAFGDGGWGPELRNAGSLQKLGKA
jgi:hypothetical protein